MSSMKLPEVSVIVPVYNVEDYLPSCVESILTQTFTDFELILVDDGSPDSCGVLCDAYAEKDARIRVIHKENGGLSDARNKGIDAALGRFVTFIDSDDIVASNYLEYLHSAAQKYDADIVQGNITSHLEKLGENGMDRRNQPYDVKVFSGEASIKDYLLYRTHFSNATFKLIKRELFEGIRFPVGKYSEDEYTTYRLVLKSKRDVCLPAFIYYYRLREGSIVRSYHAKRFEVCDELPSLIEQDLEQAGFSCKSELDYKNMRIQLKIYNDFLQGGQYQAFRQKLLQLQERIKHIPVDFAVWDRKYVMIRLALYLTPGLYRLLVSRFRARLR